MKVKVAFICVANSCRSQMAEGFAKHYGSDVLEVYSAGTKLAERVNPNAVEVMKEVGIDISSHKPKLLDEIPSKVDILITMGCNVECPYIPCKLKEDWGLDDPDGKPLDEFRKTRDIIESKVKELIKRVKNNEINLD
ncbi:ArsC family transcriptional regulator [Thermoanaerobacterium thermosaccharolyticum]|uniref:Protein tyrosine phosphatase n=1 Tax=Thermoanaerobacterium thermosaccharolyticum TaxID=1517 RepID=A0A223I0A0_THETR|nr:arsenate reductase ArsC [Thermoanaerobacterium thermosaccharolyticum]AST58143.1 protein tyrosine phosphatase [Thermoanaerobacterium thermosaccharolyticum]PHO07107.1 ArsC family transcriptional regulator [Thermoanaerobacterium thermosaccharolyticum]